MKINYYYVTQAPRGHQCVTENLQWITRGYHAPLREMNCVCTREKHRQYAPQISIMTICVFLIIFMYHSHHWSLDIL